MKLVIEGENIIEIQAKLLQAARDIEGHPAPKAVDAPVTTGVVEQDLAIVEGPTKFTGEGEVVKQKRTRRTKAEMTATQATDLADGPANSRPVTQPETNIEQSNEKLENFRANFAQQVFLLLQTQKIDQAYIAEKTAYYGLSNLLEMKDKEPKMMEHFFNSLVSEGRI